MKTLLKNQSLLSQVELLLEERQFEKALQLLASYDGQSGEIFAARALTCFLMENYTEAVEFYKKALAFAPDQRAWQSMLKRAESNLISEINQFVPEIHFIDQHILVNALEVPEGELPLPRQRSDTRDYFREWKLMIGQYSGTLLNLAVNAVTGIWGFMAGYRDNIWTNWYRRPVFLGVLTLGYMRNRLNKYNLVNTYPAKRLVGFADLDNHAIPPGVHFFRTANGSWNNLQDPLEGAAYTRFMRNIPPENPGAVKDLLTPNPRSLSLQFLTRQGEMKEVPFLNMLSVAWIQFQNHDWISYGEITTNEWYEIPLDKDDPARRQYWQTSLLVGKTQNDPTHSSKDQAKTYLNECTHWWDGSQIYGSDQKTQTWLRSGKNGKLRIGEDGLLIRDRKGIEETAFVRNWWVGLAMMHTLFVREHNSICDHLLEVYPDWDDHRLFHTARLINAALMAKIHSLEWNAAINPNKALYQGLQSNWYGLLSGWFQSPDQLKTVTSIKVKNHELGGVMGNYTEKHGFPYGLTQEFVEVYRLHSLLPESLQIRKIDDDSFTTLPMTEVRQAASGKCTDRYGMANLLYSFGLQHPGQLVLNNYPRFMQELSIPGNPVYDLGAVDLLRARERGVPRYNAFRRAMGLTPISRFEDLTSNIAQVQLLKEAYLDDVELIDLMIGSLAEEHRPKGFAFGETIFQIFLLNATRRLQADRFYTSCYTAEYYTQEGLDWIDQNSLKTVLLRHYPALAKTGLSNIKNAFEPWDQEEQLDPERHPLRAFDRSLKNDPYRGDAFR